MAKTTQTAALPAYIALLTRKEGATSEELRVAMNRAYGPTQYQLVPIAERFGFEYSWTKPEGDVTHYHFTKVSKKLPAVKAAASRTSSMVKRGKKVA